MAGSLRDSRPSPGLERFIRWSSLCVAHSPQWLVRSASLFLSVLWFDVLRLRRRLATENVGIAFPDLSEKERAQIARASVQGLCRSFFEFIAMPSLSAKWIEDNVVFEGLEHLPTEGKGALLLTLHLGNGDFACGMMARRGLPFYLIPKDFSSQLFDRWYNGVRWMMGTRTIPPHDPQTAFKILGALKKGEHVIFALDQHMGRPYGIATRFFGRRVGTAYGMALFQSKTRAPVVPLYTYRDSQGKTHIVCEPPLDLGLPENLSKQEQLVALTQKFNDKIEELVRRYPRQWFWVHRRWKTFREDD